MLKVDTVLHPTDFSPCSRQAFLEAGFLAAKLGSRLHLFHAMLPHRDHLEEAGEAALRRLHERVDEKLAELAAAVPAGVEVVEARCDAQYPGPAIIDYANEHDADLVVLGTHGRRTVGRLLLGSVADEVTRLAGRATLTVREPAAEHPGGEVRRILVGVDFSAHSLDALEVARELAGVYGAELDLLHVVELPELPSFYTPTGFALPQDTGKLEQAAGKELDKLMAGYGGAWHGHVRRGWASVAITSLAERLDAGLVVLGSHGLSAVEKLLMGSTATRVGHLAACPVLRVSSFGKKLLFE